VAAAPTVIWSGVGHETDTTVIDHVAHTAFKTLTACAVGVVDAVRAGVDALDRSWIAVEAAAPAALDLAERRLAAEWWECPPAAPALDDVRHGAQQRRSLVARQRRLWRLDQADERLGAVAEQVRTRPERLLQVGRRFSCSDRHHGARTTPDGRWSEAGRSAPWRRPPRSSIRPACRNGAAHAARRRRGAIGCRGHDYGGRAMSEVDPTSPADVGYAAAMRELDDIVRRSTTMHSTSTPLPPRWNGRPNSLPPAANG
jgi:hypothetical protein